MAIIRQKQLFNWQTANARSDLDRLSLVLESLPDEGLVRKLERRRGSRGRNDYPVRAVWNAVLAGVVYQHQSVESLRRELLRNGELRGMCGFNSMSGAGTVPTSDAFSRFLKNLGLESKAIRDMFDSLVESLRELLPDLGRSLAADGKALPSHAKGRKNPAESSDPEADWGGKTVRGRKDDGSLWKRTTWWFGYKLHLLVDSVHELPLGFELTKASQDETTRLEGLVKGLAESHPEVAANSEQLSADRGYDSAGNNRLLFDDHGIKPLIDIRSLWKDGEETKLLDPEKTDNIVYDEAGKVYCHCPLTHKRREMAFQGFEKRRKCLKYRCPAAACGIECAGRSQCPGAATDFGRVVRVKLETDRRIFTPLARCTKAWARDYKRRSAVERVNSRIDVSFGFENHYIRGFKKMEMRIGLALAVMLALAVGHIKEGEAEKMRSLVQPRAA